MVSSGFWDAALKYNAPVTIASVVFFYILLSVIEIDLVKNSTYLIFFILLLTFNFSAYALYI